MTTKYIAMDGRAFDNQKDCENYEKATCLGYVTSDGHYVSCNGVSYKLGKITDADQLSGLTTLTFTTLSGGCSYVVGYVQPNNIKEYKLATDRFEKKLFRYRDEFAEIFCGRIAPEMEDEYVSLMELAAINAIMMAEE